MVYIGHKVVRYRWYIYIISTMVKNMLREVLLGDLLLYMLMRNLLELGAVGLVWFFDMLLLHER